MQSQLTCSGAALGSFRREEVRPKTESELTLEEESISNSTPVPLTGRKNRDQVGADTNLAGIIVETVGM